MRLSLSTAIFLLVAPAASGQPLIDAVKAHNLDKVKTILSSTVNVNQQGAGGLTPLLIASRSGDVPICQELLDHGADPNAKGNSTLTPLMEASFRGSYAIVKSLLDKGADVNLWGKMVEGPDGEPLSNPGLDIANSSMKIDAVEKSALMLAAEGEHMSVVRLLLEHGADVNKQAEWYVTVSGRQYTAKGRTALMYAVQKRFPALVKFLLDNKADVKIQESLAATQGASNGTETPGDLDLMGRPLFVKHSTALHLAAEVCNRSTTLLLLEAGADLEIKDGMNCTPLAAAIRSGCTPIVELLVEKGADVNAGKDTPGSPLILAAERGKSRLVDLLIKAGASTNQKAGESGFPLLSWAVIGGNRQVVRTLLEHGADVNAATRNNLSPLMIAAEQGEATIVRLLIDWKAKLNLKNDDGRTALILASRRGRGECVKVLLLSGADGAIRDNDGKTALIHALQEGDQKTAKLLREGGPATPGAHFVELDRLSDLIEYFSTKIDQHDYTVLQYLAFSKPYGKWDVRPLHVASLPDPEGIGTIQPPDVPKFVWGVIAHHDFALPNRNAQDVSDEFIKEGFAHKRRYCENFYPSRRLALDALCVAAELSSRSIYVQQKDLAGGEGYERVDNIYRQNRIYWRYVLPQGSPFQMSPQVDSLRGFRYSPEDESILEGLRQAGCYCMVKVGGYLVFMTGGLLGNSFGFIHGKTRPGAGSLRPLFNLALMEDLGDGFYFYVSH